ncbi:hypothetical protein OH76DRAFT_1430845 [Lentinus brumalis]|uniref:Uncharacterized protein n=1 Tax=Lentinus brumalis TaxID=2498619 RepID=A0A371DNN1_9APHY|nr:hypothetical protein OH76DRAFT_1430845 [Polyporus brumalis]
MCVDIIGYIEWACGFRQHTGRQHLDCHRSICRLSDMHQIDEHDCDIICTGTRTEDHHLVTDTYRAVCEHCEAVGREEHPGIQRKQAEGGASDATLPLRYRSNYYA